MIANRLVLVIAKYSSDTFTPNFQKTELFFFSLFLFQVHKLIEWCVVNHFTCLHTLTIPHAEHRWSSLAWLEKLPCLFGWCAFAFFCVSLFLSFFFPFFYLVCLFLAAGVLKNVNAHKFKHTHTQCIYLVFSIYSLKRLRGWDWTSSAELRLFLSAALPLTVMCILSFFGNFRRRGRRCETSATWSLAERHYF